MKRGIFTLPMTGTIESLEPIPGGYHTRGQGIQTVGNAELLALAGIDPVADPALPALPMLKRLVPFSEDFDAGTVQVEIAAVDAWYDAIEAYLDGKPAADVRGEADRLEEATVGGRRVLRLAASSTGRFPRLALARAARDQLEA